VKSRAYENSSEKPLCELLTKIQGVTANLPSREVNPLRLDEGDGYTVETGGGGGFGDPLERPAE
jgi:N-methylhydantoinase B/oxoprolinase/acetone carboxylase alpha subunit